MKDITLEDISKGVRTYAPDPISVIVKDAFRSARMFRAAHRLGERTVDSVLRMCYDQYNGVITPFERELIESSGIDIKISMTKNKVDVLEAWVRNLLQESADSPFVVKPTPIPTLSDDDLQHVAQSVVLDKDGLDQLSVESSPEEVAAYRDSKIDEYRQKLEKVADTKASNMQRLIDDQLVEGGFREQYIAFMRNLVQYPYAVMLGPILENRASLKWTKRGVVDSFNVVPVVRNISPFDYFWSPDTKVGGTGQFDIIRERVTREYLRQCSTLQSWIKPNVDAALNDYDRLRGYNYDWPFGLTEDDPDRTFITPSISTTDCVTVLRYFGKVNGAVLDAYGITGVPHEEYREIEAVVLGEYTLRLRVRQEPISAGRPIYVTSYQKTNDGVAGFGIPQLVEPIERAFMAAIRASVSNAAFLAVPMGEVDVSRVKEYLDVVEKPFQIRAGTMLPVSPSLSNTSEPAFRFYNVPNNTASLCNLAAYFQQMADQYTGLPAALSGQPVGTGVNRTFRGVAQLYSNALKGVQSAFTNVDTDVLERLGTNFYVYNMVYSNDSSIKGDCRVMSRGMAGLLKQELDKQQKLDLLQAMGQMAAMVPPAVVADIVKDVAVSMGYSEQRWDAAERMSQQAQQAQQVQQAPQEVPEGGQGYGGPPQGM